MASAVASLRRTRALPRWKRREILEDVAAALIEQKERFAQLRKALSHIVGHPQRDRVWFTRPGEIFRYAASLPPGVIAGSSG